MKDKPATKRFLEIERLVADLKRDCHITVVLDSKLFLALMEEL